MDIFWSFSTNYYLDCCSAFLAHFLLKERLQRMGVVGCVACIVGSVVIVLHAPQEQTPNSVEEIWTLATQPGHKCSIFFFGKFELFPPRGCWCACTNLLPLCLTKRKMKKIIVWISCRWLIESLVCSLSAAFLIYVAATISIVLALVLYFEPRYGQTNILVYIGICSFVGSITVSIFICESAWKTTFF